MINYGSCGIHCRKTNGIWTHCGCNGCHGGKAPPLLWPDGQPVTPWADPWHDILADVRAIAEWPGR